MQHQISIFVVLSIIVFIFNNQYVVIAPNEDRVVVSLTSRGNINVLKTVAFCIGCPNPEEEGSIAFGLIPKYSVKQTYSVQGELVYCIPNHAESESLLNKHFFRRRVVFVDRGTISFKEKALRIQAAGAVGVVIGDDGTCNDGFTFCGTRVGSVSEGGLAPYDDPELWIEIQIPIILISLATSNQLKKMMKTERLDFPIIGSQNVATAFNEDEDEFDDEDFEL
eukprot:gene7414-10106_t